MSDEVANTDRELWRERESDYYADCIFVTESGGVGINVAGHVIVRPLREWFTAASILNPALADVANERRRQQDGEGWTAEHDGEHTDGELAMAAACYAMFAEKGYRTIYPPEWPWDAQWWKPSTHRRNLVKAAALLIAEIQRLDRLPAPPSEDKPK